MGSTRPVGGLVVGTLFDSLSGSGCVVRRVSHFGVLTITCDINGRRRYLSPDILVRPVKVPRQKRKRTKESDQPFAVAHVRRGPQGWEAR